MGNRNTMKWRILILLVAAFIAVTAAGAELPKAVKSDEDKKIAVKKIADVESDGSLTVKDNKDEPEDVESDGSLTVKDNKDEPEALDADSDGEMVESDEEDDIADQHFNVEKSDPKSNAWFWRRRRRACIGRHRLNTKYTFRRRCFYTRRRCDGRRRSAIGRYVRRRRCYYRRRGLRRYYG